MRAVELMVARLTRPDMMQLLTLLLAVLVLVLGFSWPSGGGTANESWFSLTPVRNACLALVAAGYGAAQGLVRLPGGNAPTCAAANALSEARLTLVALLTWVLITAPFEVISHAASYPSAHVAWSALVSLVTVPAYYGLGLLVRKLAALLRLGWALPVMVPGVIVGLGWLDLRLDTSLFNPWTAALNTSPYPVVAGVATLLTVLLLLSWNRGGRNGLGAPGGATPDAEGVRS